MYRLLCAGISLVGFALAAAGASAETPFAIASPSWSPDGKSIAFEGRVGHGLYDIYTMSVDGTGLRNVTPDDPASNEWPSWSRRGGLIAFESEASHQLVRYSVIAPDGSGRRDLALTEAAGPIHWSPGDRYIAFDAHSHSETLALGAACCDSPRAIAPGLTGPWAPRVLRLAVGVESRLGMRLMTTTPAGTLRRALTGGHTFLGLLAWSRDERWILFKGQRFGARSVDLWVVRVTTGLTRRLAVGAWIGSFAPDSKHVVYSAPKGGLFVVSVDGRSRRRLSADGADPQWSPDGSWISFRSSVGIELLRPDGTDRHPLLGP